MPGFAHGQLRSARRLRKGIGAPALTPLPQQASLVARWSADAIPAQADNTDLASWTDGVSAIVANANGTAPKYRTGGAGGKPYVLFNGTGELNVGTGANAAATALQSATSTSFVVYRNPLATSFGFLFTATNSTGHNLFNSGGAAGMYGQGAQRFTTTTPANTLQTIGYAIGQPDGTAGRAYINGSCIGHAGQSRGVAGQNICIGGSAATTSTRAKAEIYEVLVYNVALNASQMMQLVKWAHDKYGAAYPWAGGPFRVFHGDSLTNGTGSTGPNNSYPAKVAQLNGWALGTWSNLGHVGARYDNTPASLTLEAVGDVDGMVPLLGATPLHLATWEWFNGKATANYQALAASYLAARKAAGVAKILFMTSTDAADTMEGATQAARATYNAYWDVAGNRSNIDAYVPLHLNANLGVEGACPNASPYTPYFYTDGIHILDAGYAVMAGLVSGPMAAM